MSMEVIKQAPCAKNVLDLLALRKLKFTLVTSAEEIPQSAMVEWLYTEFDIWVSVRRVKSTSKYLSGWRFEVDIPAQPLLRYSLKSYASKEAAYNEAFSFVIKYYIP